MPEPNTDRFRESPTLELGLKKPDPYPIRAMLYTTDDEAYQFRQPNTAYMKPNTPEFELPVGLVSDGSQPRHWGDPPVRLEDDDTVNRHNQSHPGFAAVQSKIEGEGYSAKSAGAILASASRNASPGAKKANPRLKKVSG